MKHNEFCPIILEQNKKWNHSITAYCTCNKVITPMTTLQKLRKIVENLLKDNLKS